MCTYMTMFHLLEWIGEFALPMRWQCDSQKRDGNESGRIDWTGFDVIWPLTTKTWHHVFGESLAWSLGAGGSGCLFACDLKRGNPSFWYVWMITHHVASGWRLESWRAPRQVRVPSSEEGWLTLLCRCMFLLITKATAVAGVVSALAVV